MSTPTPKTVRADLMGGKLAKLSPLMKRKDLRLMHAFKVNDRITLPSSQSEDPHRGTVIHTDARGFRVAWDGHGRKRGESRERVWYPWANAHTFHKEEAEHG